MLSALRLNDDSCIYKVLTMGQPAAVGKTLASDLKRLWNTKGLYYRFEPETDPVPKLQKFFGHAGFRTYLSKNRLIFDPTRREPSRRFRLYQNLSNNLYLKHPIKVLWKGVSTGVRHTFHCAKVHGHSYNTYKGKLQKRLKKCDLDKAEEDPDSEVRSAGEEDFPSLEVEKAAEDPVSEVRSAGEQDFPSMHDAASSVCSFPDTISENVDQGGRTGDVPIASEADVETEKLSDPLEKKSEISGIVLMHLTSSPDSSVDVSKRGIECDETCSGLASERTQLVHSPREVTRPFAFYVELVAAMSEKLKGSLPIVVRALTNDVALLKDLAKNIPTTLHQIQGNIPRYVESAKAISKPIGGLVVRMKAPSQTALNALMHGVVHIKDTVKSMPPILQQIHGLRQLCPLTAKEMGERVCGPLGHLKGPLYMTVHAVRDKLPHVKEFAKNILAVLAQIPGFIIPARFKTNFEGDIRIFPLLVRTFADLHATLSSRYGLDHFVVLYVDEEGDFVTISADDELAEMLPDKASGLYPLVVRRTASVAPWMQNLHF